MTDAPIPVHHHARLVFDPAELAYDFGAEHPMQAKRIAALMDLLGKSGLWDSANEQTSLPVRAATVEELRLIHTADYIAAVQRLSQPEESDASPEQQKERQELIMR